MIYYFANFPVLVFVVSFFVLWVVARISANYARRRNLDEEVHKDFDIVLGGTLTLLGLIIGFNMLAAISRYDLRKSYEWEEANAIGTEYARVDFLPAADRDKVRKLLAVYLDQRILFFVTSDRSLHKGINDATLRLQDQLWNAIVPPATAQPTPVMAIVVSGMNDVLNRQGYTQAAFWNRIPEGAWALMMAVAICCNILIGYNVRDKKARELLVILPLVASISFFLIADVDSPRRGVITVEPQNLQALADSLRR
jgi:hypothetical protein